MCSFARARRPGAPKSSSAAPLASPAVLSLLLGAGRAVAAVLALSTPKPAAPERAPVDPLVWPASGTVTSTFGYRGGGFHSGLDIGILRSLTVRAARAGTVTRAGEQPGYEGYGTIVEVRVSSTVTMTYAHLAAVRVRVGQRVSAGQSIGVAGCTGSCTGTHLHFEVRRAGRAVDPLGVLRAARIQN